MRPMVKVGSDDSYVGYRIRERLGTISAPNDVVGRSRAVSGTLVIAGGALTAAQVTVDMTQLRTDVGSRDERMREDGLQTVQFPTATFTLTRPVPLGEVSGGRVVSLELPGDLTLHGVTRPVVFPLQARWDGATIQVAGSMPIRRPEFGLEVPSLVGFRIEERGVVELELTLTRKGAALAAPVPTLGGHAAVPEPGQGEPGRPQGPPCKGGRPPAGGGRLLFAAIADDDLEHLYTVGADGRGLRQVIKDPEDAFHLEPAWSPDGSRIAYVKDGAVHVMRADGTGDRAVTRSSEDTAPAWSPDGRRLSWVRDGNLFVARADGAAAARVRTGRLLTSGARWQPGGR